MIGDGVDRVNMECRRYSIKEEQKNKDEFKKWRPLENLIWVDTVGWNDKNLDGKNKQS